MIDDDPGPQGTGPDDAAPNTARAAALSPRLRLAVSAVLAALLIASVVVGTLSFSSWRDAEAEQDARRDVVRVAEQFTARVNNYDADSVDSYQESVTSMLTTKFSADFAKAMEDIVSQVREAEMVSTGEVLTSGVASVDDDSARVLVVADANVSTVFDDRARHFRWQVSLVKVDGEWLVDDFTPVV